MDIEKLKRWFLANKRDMPWRETDDPYAIWISEVMLQQTQAAVVIPYYLRWMERFPTVQKLAEAAIEEVIKLWEGLGYYSRARSLHEGARYLVENHGGQLPNNEKELSLIKGLGPYTVGAILSFAFHQKKSAVDGNVMRVVARYFALNDDIAKQASFKKFRGLVESFLPEDESWIVNEALIELGATICQRKSACRKCPVSATCLSFHRGLVDELPIKTKGPQTTRLHRLVAVIECDGQYLVKKGKAGEIMADLYEFFYVEATTKDDWETELVQILKRDLALNPLLTNPLPEVSHSFTRYQAKLSPYFIQVKKSLSVAGYTWVSKQELVQLPFSSGHRKIFQSL